MSKDGPANTARYRACLSSTLTIRNGVAAASDTREPNLELQAFNAIHGHEQNTREPTALELDLIKEFQQTDSRFFSSEAVRGFANGGPPPQLPPGTTESERRGRAMFDNVPFDGATTKGICNTCHSGPMLNRFATGNPFGGPPGGRRADIGINERNLIGNPLYTFIVTNPDGTVVAVTTPAPGAMLNDPPPSAPPGVPTPPRSFFANLFKNSDAMGHQRHCSVLPRQLCEDTRRCRGTLCLLHSHKSEYAGVHIHGTGPSRRRRLRNYCVD